MLIIGIDPSFSGTGITAEWMGDIIFQAEFSLKLDKAKEFYIPKLLIDKSKTIGAAFKWPRPKSKIDDGDMQRIIDYSHNLSAILTHLIIYGAILNTDENVYIAIEIPMGGHMGAGAKVDRCYAAALMAMDNCVNKISFGNITILAIHPKTIKKFITGNGNTKKNIVSVYLVSSFNYKSNYMKNFNISDSFAIMEYLKHDIQKATQDLLK